MIARAVKRLRDRAYAVRCPGRRPKAVLDISIAEAPGVFNALAADESYAEARYAGLGRLIEHVALELRYIQARDPRMGLMAAGFKGLA